jgi:hypothetical protein
MRDLDAELLEARQRIRVAELKVLCARTSIATAEVIDLHRNRRSEEVASLVCALLIHRGIIVPMYEKRSSGSLERP